MLASLSLFARDPSQTEEATANYLLNVAVATLASLAGAAELVCACADAMTLLYRRTDFVEISWYSGQRRYAVYADVDSLRDLPCFRGGQTKGVESGVFD